MVPSHGTSFDGDRRRGRAACPVEKELAAKLVNRAEGKCQLKGNADGRGSATTDLSQTFPQLGQADILTARQIALPGTSVLKRQYMRPGHILHCHYVQSAA